MRSLFTTIEYIANTKDVDSNQLLIIMMAYKYWKIPSIAATGLSNTVSELNDLTMVPPMFCLIFLMICLPKSPLTPINYFICIYGTPNLNYLTDGINMKYSILNISYL